jgi:hypothetical protein
MQKEINIIIVSVLMDGQVTDVKHTLETAILAARPVLVPIRIIVSLSSQMLLLITRCAAFAKIYG